ncbi:MAG TPA: ADOP family duplicated permease [Gemmatimonadaceae bacterium]|nr:ADOP family duplicated permease [Gemmatimonadaceae bacterium]
MSHVPAWRRYLRFWRPDVRADIDDELRFHFDTRIAELRAHGLSADEARRRTIEEFGDEHATRQRLEEIGHRMERRRARFLWWDAARADLRYALRGLASSPLFTGTVVLTLAIGIAAATTMYGVMRRLLIQPPPGVAAPEQVRKVYFGHKRPGDSLRIGDGFSFDFFELARDRARTIADIGAYMPDVELAVGDPGEARIAQATLVSGGFWRTLGARPALGRFIADDEAHPATGARVVVLGHAFWQRHFGGDPDVVGTTLRVKGLPYRIVGVAPRGFRGVELGDTDLWLPLFAYADGDRSRREWWTGSFGLSFVTRVSPAATLPQAGADLARLRRTAEDRYNRRFLGDAAAPAPLRPVALAPVTGALGDDMQPIPEATVSIWLVGVAFVLLAIAAANVASLLLLRAMRRRREIAVRLALGMSRRRLAALLFTESLLLAVLGGVASTVLVIGGGAWVRRTLLSAMAWESAGVDWRMLALAAACTIGAAALAALAPALQARRDAVAGWRDGGQRGGARRTPLQRLLLASQTALSVLLLVGAGLFLRSLQRVASLDLGLDTRDVLTVEVDFTGSGRTGPERMAFFERALERLRTLPGVRAASLALEPPLSDSHMGMVIRFSGASDWFRPDNGGVVGNRVADRFFDATGMQLLQGRPITAADRTGPRVAVVNEALARAGWPDRSPVGDCVYTSSARDVCTEIVGVVKDARTFALLEPAPSYAVYVPLAPDVVDSRVLLVRRDPAVRGMEATVRRALRELDPGLPYVDVRVLGDVLNPEIRPWRLGATLFTTFGVVAMLLAALGLYAAVAYAVAQRTREIGVRVAVGATAGSVVRLVLGDGARVALIGIAAGLGLALLGAPFIADLLFDVSPRDPLVLASVGGGVLLAALLASLLPARRAARVDPVTALRAD